MPPEPLGLLLFKLLVAFMAFLSITFISMNFISSSVSSLNLGLFFCNVVVIVFFLLSWCLYGTFAAFPLVFFFSAHEGP